MKLKYNIELDIPGTTTMGYEECLKKWKRKMKLLLYENSGIYDIKIEGIMEL